MTRCGHRQLFPYHLAIRLARTIPRPARPFGRPTLLRGLNGESLAKLQVLNPCNAAFH